MRENVTHYTHAARENRDRIREARVNGPDHAPDPRMPAAGPGRSDTAPRSQHRPHAFRAVHSSDLPRREQNLKFQDICVLHVSDAASFASSPYGFTLPQPAAPSDAQSPTPDSAIEYAPSHPDDARIRRSRPFHCTRCRCFPVHRPRSEGSALSVSLAQPHASGAGPRVLRRCVPASQPRQCTSLA